jgi:nucleotide-binding universal stress UspA family protein
MNIKRILCPTDLSGKSDLALLYATALARTYDAKLYLCYCAGSRRVAEALAGVPLTVPAHFQIEGLFEQSLDPYLHDDAPPLNWEGFVINGTDAAESIVNEAAKLRADLLVMCSRRRPMAAALLGSVTEAVCRTAPCPVLVTHPDEREWVDETTGAINLNRVLVAHDFSDYAELAMKCGAALAQEYQAALHLLHVLPPPRTQEPELAWSVAPDSPYHHAARRLQRALPRESPLWCEEIVTAVLEGSPYREILNYAEEKEIDLICLGAHGANFGAKTLFGSNVDRVLRQAGCPVLVARPLRTGH